MSTPGENCSGLQRQDKMEFCWSTYLLQCNSEAVPDAAFIQVEKSLSSEIQPLQTVEILQNAEVSQCYFTDIVKHKRDEKSLILQDETKFASSLIKPQPALKSITTSKSLSGPDTCLNEKNNKCVSVKTYWIAQVTTVCGPLLRVKYVLPTGYSAPEFWVQVGADELKHIGYGADHDIIPVLPTTAVPCTEVMTQPPKRDIKDEKDICQKSILPTDSKFNSNYSSPFSCENAIDVLRFIFYITSSHVPVAKEALDESTRSYFKRIGSGKYIEVLDNCSRKQSWPAIVMQNVGGRLLLRHACTTNTSTGRDESSYQTDSSQQQQSPDSIKGATDIFDSTSLIQHENPISLIKTGGTTCSSMQNDRSSATILDTKSELRKDIPEKIIVQDTRSNILQHNNRSSSSVETFKSAIAMDFRESTSGQSVTSTQIQDTPSSVSEQPLTKTTSAQDITCNVLREESNCGTTTQTLISSSSTQIISNSMKNPGTSIMSTQESTNTAVPHSSSPSTKSDTSSSTNSASSLYTEVTDSTCYRSAQQGSSRGTEGLQDDLACNKHCGDSSVDTVVQQCQLLPSEALSDTLNCSRVSAEALHVDGLNPDKVSERVGPPSSVSEGACKDASPTNVESQVSSASSEKDSSVSKDKGQDSSNIKSWPSTIGVKDGHHISVCQEPQNVVESILPTTTDNCSTLQTPSGSKDKIQCVSDATKNASSSISTTDDRSTEVNEGSVEVVQAQFSCSTINVASKMSSTTTNKDGDFDDIGSPGKAKIISELTQAGPNTITPVQDCSTVKCSSTNISISQLHSVSNQNLHSKTDQAIPGIITSASDNSKIQLTEDGTSGASSAADRIDDDSVSSNLTNATSVCLPETIMEVSCKGAPKVCLTTTKSSAAPDIPDSLTCFPSECVADSFTKDFWLFCTNERLRNMGCSSGHRRPCRRHQLLSDNSEDTSCVWQECMSLAVTVPLPVRGHPALDQFSDPQAPKMEEARGPSEIPDPASIKVEKLNDTSIPNICIGRDEPALGSCMEEKMEVDCSEKDVDTRCSRDNINESNLINNNSNGSVNTGLVDKDCKDGLPLKEIRTGMVLEVLHPYKRMCCVHAAIITKVWNEDQIEVRFDACKFDEGFKVACSPVHKERQDTETISPSLTSLCEQRNSDTKNNYVEDLVFDGTSLQWKWKTHARDHRLLPAGFCSKHNIRLHSLLEDGKQRSDMHTLKTELPFDSLMPEGSLGKMLPSDSPPALKEENNCTACNTGSACLSCKERQLKSRRSESLSRSRQSPSKPLSTNTDGNSSNVVLPSTRDYSPTENSSFKPDSSLVKMETNEFAQETINEFINIDVEIVEKIPEKVVSSPTTSIIKTESTVDDTVSSSTSNNSLVSNAEQVDKITLLVEDSLVCAAGEQKSTVQRHECPGDPNPVFSWKCSPWCSATPLETTVRCPMAEELGFLEHQKLETVHPHHPNMLCVATIVTITGHLLWIRLDSKDDAPLSSEEDREADSKALRGSAEQNLFHMSCCCQRSVVVVLPCDSDEIFPAGFAQSHGAMFRVPRKCLPMEMDTEQESPRPATIPPLLSTPHQDNLSSCSRWCPQLHLNYTCAPGPFLSRTKLACQGGVAVAGTVASVLAQVVAQSLAAGFCPTKLTKDLATAQQKVALPDWSLMDIKAKCKRYSVRGRVLAPAVRRDVPAFLEQLFVVLQCCPNLWSNTRRALCPYNCKQPVPALTSSGRRRRAALPSSVSLLGATCQPGDEDLEEEDDEGEDDPAPAPEWGDEGAPAADPCDEETDASWLRSNTRTGDGALKRPRAEAVLPDVATKKRKVNRAWAIQPAEVDNDPLTWSINDVYEYVSKDPSVCHHASWLRKERVDGRALLLLNLATLVQELRLPHRALLPLAHLLCRIKMAHLLKRGVE